jgi:hypothetical protein
VSRRRDACVSTETGSRPQITFLWAVFSSQCNPTISGSTARITRVFRTVIVRRPRPLRSPYADQ